MVRAALLRDGDTITRRDGTTDRIRWVRTGFSRQTRAMETGVFYVTGGARMYPYNELVEVLQREAS